VIPVNVTGNEVFGTPGEADNIFKIMEQMITDLAAGDHGKIGDALELIDQRISKAEAAQRKDLRRRFAAVDADQDGYLTKAEFAARPSEEPFE